MGTKERRERERVDTREKILNSAREMFAEEGYEAVTMRAIADRIEYTPTALYHHFPSKQALLTELCECDFAGLARHFQNLASMTDPIERIRAIGEAYLGFAMQYPSQYRFMFMTMLPPIPFTPEQEREHIDAPERNAYAFLRQACVEAIAQGRLRPEYDDPDILAQILWGTVHGIVSVRVTKGHQEFVPWKDLRETVRVASELLIRGMLRQP